MDYKGYKVEYMGSFPMIHIKAKGQGMVPKVLDGHYTSIPEAHKAIDIFLESLKKGNSNGKTKDTSSG